MQSNAFDSAEQLRTDVTQVESLAIENHQEHENLTDDQEDKENEASRTFQRSLDFLWVLGAPMGADLTYEWNQRNVRFVLTKGWCLYFWTQMLYTQFLHFYRRNSKKTLEIFALYGVIVSVNENS